MKKIIFRVLIIFFLIISFLITYLSTAGIKTARFNSQIGNLIKNFNEDLRIEIKDVKIILDPTKFELNLKTLGPKLRIKERSIELESIKTQISINSFIKNEFSVKNLDISTKSIKVENLISFFRNIKNSPELFMLKKIFKKGYLISDINLEFDEKGKIKDNYSINGLLKDSQITLSKKYDFNKINLIFNFKNKLYKFSDIRVHLNDIELSSDKVEIKKSDNDFLIEGIIENKEISQKNKIVENFTKTYFTKLDIENLNLNSKNKFSFKMSKTLKIDNLKVSSEVKLNNLEVVNKLNLKRIFPNFENKINLNNHLINIKYVKKKLFISGNGNVLFQNKNDVINYKITKNNELFDFETNLKIDKNPLTIDSLGYIKKKDIKSNIDLKGSYLIGQKTEIERLSFKENRNQFEVNQLILDKDFKIKKFQKINLTYFDQDLRENEISILNNNNNSYNLAGSKFNANILIEDLINNDSSKDLKIFSQDFGLNVKIDQVYLDKEHVLNNLEGNLDFKKNTISNTELNARFSKNQKFKFTIKSNNQEKVTTLFIDKAEPIVRRYKFIKGYNGGSLDFYSLKKNDKSISNLKIYDFRLKELPVLTKLLTLASLQGIAEILSGEGITFDEFEMNFNNINNLLTIDEMYAIGPAISILMEGYVEKNKLVSLRGSLVPATTINKAIGNIPVLGKILVGSKTGEGVFGVSFKIKGPPKNLETTVNPIKTLTPRFITRTLEKIKNSN